MNEDIPLLPITALSNAEIENEGYLWAWTATPGDWGWLLAVARANDPTLTVEESMLFASHEETARAAHVHNEERWLTPTEVNRIVRSALAAKIRYEAVVVEAFDECRAGAV